MSDRTTLKSYFEAGDIPTQSNFSDLIDSMALVSELVGGGDALVSNPLSQFAATTSDQLAGVISDETGTGLLVFATNPVLTTPNIGAATGASLVLSGNVVATGSSSNAITAGTGTDTKYIAINGANSGSTGGAALRIQNAGSDIMTFGNASAITGGTYNAEAYINANTGPMRFALASSEKMRISAGGNLLVGTTFDDGANIVQVGGGLTCTTAKLSGLLDLRPAATANIIQFATNGFLRSDTSQLTLYNAGTAANAISFNRGGTSLCLASTYALGFAATTQADGGTVDTLYSRQSAGVHQFGTTANNASGRLACRSIKFGGNLDEISPSSDSGFFAFASNQGVGVAGAAAAKTVFKVVGTASQTSPLQEWQTSAGVMVASVDVSGNFYTYGNITTSGNVICSAAGKGLQVKSGTGARAGNATLVAGTVTVTNTTVTANTVIYLTVKTIGGTVGTLSYTLSAGASFTINSASVLDTSVISYILVEVNP
jgi:hypothetical protein